MANAYNLVKSENLMITSEYPIPNVYKSLTETKLITPDTLDVDINTIPLQHCHTAAVKTEPHSHTASVKTEPADNILLECEKSDIAENNVRHDLTDGSCLIDRDKPTFFLQNHETLVPWADQTVESFPAESVAGDKKLTITLSTSSLSEKQLIKTDTPYICVSDVSKEHGGNATIKTEPTDNTLSEGGLLITEKLHVSQNDSRLSLADNICHRKKDKPADVKTAIPEVNPLKESVPARTHNSNPKEQKLSHSEKTTFACDLCDKSFAFRSRLTLHKRTHTGEKPFVCDICDKGFALKAALINHIRTHTGEKPFVCDLCDKPFSDPSGLRAHKRSHTGVKPYFCDICDKTFSRSSNLARHIGLHTGESPFVCDVCDKPFSRSVHLTRHKLTHSLEKPFVCDICKKRFSLASSLVKHKRIHTGDKPFVCSLCDKRFVHASSLARHQGRHT